MDITLVKRENINDKLWNGCVHYAVNGLPYAYTWYLDNVCENWYGLVYDNYQAVMPLVYNRKYGIDYLFQPYFSQRLGVYAMEPISDELLKQFYQAIPEQYKYYDFNVNANNRLEDSQLELIQRDNYELSLNKTYEELESAFSGNLKRNIKKAEKAGLKLHNNVKPEELVQFYMKHTAGKIPGFKEYHKHSLMRLIYHAQHYNSGGTFGVKNQKGELVATNFVLYFPKKIINLAPSINQEGKEHGAMAFLLSILIRMNETKPMVLDFEGSSIEGIARFYKGFGAKLKPYWRIRKNQLPWYLKLLKK